MDSPLPPVAIVEDVVANNEAIIEAASTTVANGVVLVPPAVSIAHPIDPASLALLATTDPQVVLKQAATAAAVLSSVVVPLALSIQQSSPSVVDILRDYRVPLYDTDLSRSIQALDILQEQLNHCQRQQNSLLLTPCSPGFITSHSDQGWSADIVDMPYERWNTSNACMLLPSFAFAAECCARIRAVLLERHEYLQTVSPNVTNAAVVYCPCFSEWSHFPSSPAFCLTNQAMEQFMVREASDWVDDHINITEWEESYSLERTVLPSLDEFQLARIRVLPNRDLYMQTLTQLAVQAQHSIQISTCYLFSFDPAVRYIILDLLPYLTKKNNIKINILLDLFTQESAIVRSGFYPAEKRRNSWLPDETHKSNSISNYSFINLLPDTAPPTDRAFTEYNSPLDFLYDLADISMQNPNVEIRWWAARDHEAKYRVKNHCKCIVFDGQVAIMGGSNLVPTVSAAESELDIVIVGDAVQEGLMQSFTSLWNASAPSHLAINRSPPPKNECLLASLENKFEDNHAKVKIVRSLPSSSGEDAIYRVILAAIGIAQHRIIISMGHSNYPKSLGIALAAATARGVQVQVLSNSKYSCDLLVNQRDMMLSSRDLMRVAPNVEYYTTSWKPGEKRTPFAHAKYVCIDGRWSAVGSWNVWTRGSFYELEHEALIESESVAKILEQKFENDKKTTTRIWTAQELEPGAGWCPTGCSVCRGFGSFFQP